MTIAFSSILVRLSHTAPSTSAVFRCLYALPVLAVLARREDLRLGARPSRDRVLAFGAGVFLGLDLLFWHRSIADIGAGLATVLANLQVAAVPLLAWAVLGERPGRRVLAALPVVLLGIVLISGALEQGGYGRDPAAGAVFGVLTGLMYAGFILVLRQSSADRRPAGGLVIGDVDLVPWWPGHGWLVVLALTSQVLGWLVISISLPRLPAALASMLLTIQPIGSVVLGAIIFAEAPSALQVAGVVALLSGLVAVARTGPAPPASAWARRQLRSSSSSARLGPGSGGAPSVVSSSTRSASPGRAMTSSIVARQARAVLGHGGAVPRRDVALGLLVQRGRERGRVVEVLARDVAQRPGVHEPPS